MCRGTGKARKRSRLGLSESAAILPSCRIKVCARQPLCDAFAEPLIGIPLACHVDCAIDSGELVQKSASLVNFGRVVCVTTSKFLLILPM